MPNLSNSKIDDLRRVSSLAMSKETGYDFTECYAYQSLFLNDLKDEDFYNIRISMSTLDGNFNSTKNIIKNLNDTSVLDIGEGLGVLALAGVAAAGRELAVNSILAIFFFVRTFKKLSTLKLKRDHVFFLLAIRSLDDSVDITGPEKLVRQVNLVIKEYGEPTENFDVEKCNKIYSDLNELGVVCVQNNQLILVEDLVIEY